MTLLRPLPVAHLHFINDNLKHLSVKKKVNGGDSAQPIECTTAIYIEVLNFWDWIRIRLIRPDPDTDQTKF